MGTNMKIAALVVLWLAYLAATSLSGILSGKDAAFIVGIFGFFATLFVSAIICIIKAHCCHCEAVKQKK